jgi:hypothetical protein
MVAVLVAMVLTGGGSSSAADVVEINLSGKWSINCEGGGVYYLRQVGNEVWWVGESPDGGRGWTNLGHGTIEGEDLIVHWADAPKGSFRGTGILTLKLVVQDGKVATIKKVKQVGDFFGGDTFKRE